MSKKQGQFFLGQKVMVLDVNHKAPSQRTVTKVGRLLVTVGEGWSTEVFRLDSRKTDDGYGHATIFTMEEWADKEEREKLVGALGNVGVLFTRPGNGLSLACLRDMLDVVNKHQESETGNT